MKSKLVFISLVSLLGLFSAACSVHFTTVINSDGSGDFKIKYVITEKDIQDVEDEFDQDFEDFLDDQFGENDLEEVCNVLEDEGDLPRSADAEYSEAEGEFSCEITIPFDDIDELVEIYEDLDIGEIRDIDLGRDGDLTYELDMDMTDAEGEDEFGVSGIEYLWIVTVPGSVEDSNASEVKGRTLTWELEPGYVERIDLIAGPGGLLTGLIDASSVWWIFGFGLFCLCGLALAGGGAGFYFYTKKKKEADIA